MTYTGPSGETAIMYLDAGVVVEIYSLTTTCVEYLRPELVPLFEFLDFGLFA